MLLSLGKKKKQYVWLIPRIFSDEVIEVVTFPIWFTNVLFHCKDTFVDDDDIQLVIDWFDKNS